jgi:hypothetical protein
MLKCGRRLAPGIRSARLAKSLSVRAATSVGTFDAPTRRDNLSDKIEMYEIDMLRPFENRDAILGHVASRGDRNPRAAIKSSAAVTVNAVESDERVCSSARKGQKG